MSVPVPLDEQPGAIERFGLRPYRATLAPDGGPRAPGDRAVDPGS